MPDTNANIAKVRAALKKRDQEIKLEALLSRRLGPGRQRSMMTDEQQLAQPEAPVSESSFLLPDRHEIDPGSPLGGSPDMGIAMPIGGWNRFNRKRFKQAYDEGVNAVGGGFDKILEIIKPRRGIRPWEQERQVIDSARGNWEAGLPDKYDTVTGLMKQKAAQDTRAALKQRAGRIDRGDTVPTGGYYLGLEPLDNTVVKSASLHHDYDPLTPSTNSKFNALRAPDFNPNPKLLQENIELDARKRVAIDDLLATRSLAPQSMYVRTPKTSYVVQDRAQKSMQDTRNDLLDHMRRLRAENDSRHVAGDIDQAEHLRRDRTMRDDYQKSIKDLENLAELTRKDIGNYAHPSDWHPGNSMFADGKLKSVDTQGYLVPTKDPAKSVMKDYSGDWMEPDPIPNESRRSVTFKRGK